jgi:nucleoporin NDC1
MSNLLFSSFLGQPPLKKGRPLTDEAKDPNGSLINGLKAKKELVKAFAFWELCCISQQFPDRRKMIFNDIDRDGGAAWTQILDASGDVIKGITARINDFQNPQPAIPPSSAPVAGSKESGQTSDGKPVIQTLPHIASPPKEGDIFLPSPRPVTRTEKFETVLGSVAKSYGQSADWTPAARAKARDIVDRASTVMLSPEQKRKISATAQDLKLLTGTSGKRSDRTTHPLLQQLMRLPICAPFRQPYARRLRSVVLGSPYGGLAPIFDATESLTRLLVASLAEDKFGKVQADVPTVVRLLTNVIKVLEAFVSEEGLGVHWTDVIYPSSTSDQDVKKTARRVEEVEIVLAALKAGLAELLGAFMPYLNEVGLVGKDLRLAREAAGISETSTSATTS